MTDDEFRRMAEDANQDANASMTFAGIIIIAALCSFVACSIAAIIGWLGG